MSFLLKDTIHQTLAESVYNEFLSRRSNFYYFIGRALRWGVEETPDTPLPTRDYEYETRNNIITVKRVNVKDVSFVIPRIDWTAGVVYDQYDPNYSSSFTSSNGATSLKQATFYVLTSTFGVYKCLFNNSGAQSTIEPFGTDVSPVTYADGYIWKYMYTVPLSARNRFLTADFIPVQRSVDNAFYSNGEISSVVIDNPGSGYLGNALVTLSVGGNFIGRPGNVVANLTPVLSDSGQFLDIIIDNPGNNYSNATITITDVSGTGTSFIKGVSNVGILNTGSGYTPAVRNNTIVSIRTTGVVQPLANAVVSPVYSPNNNTLIGVTVIGGGSGYISSVRSNTSLVISTTGNSTPTVTASGVVQYNDTARLIPVLYDGKIVDVLIDDPGIGYSANNQTTISTIGDGTGVVLQPVINKAGQIQDVIVLERGQGYTYLDIEVVGAGANANVSATISTGDLTTLQSVVELSAIDGGIHAIKITNPGDGYTAANVILYGDGHDFAGNVVITNNTISKIVITNPGRGYTYANVMIDGNGTGANVSAIISPTGGHGKDAVKEFFADTLMVYSTINNEKNHGIEVTNDYRQTGLLKNITKYNNDQTFTGLTGSACHLVTLDSTSNLSQDDILIFTDNNGQNREFEIVEVKPSTNQVLLNNKNNVNLANSNVLVSAALTNYTVQNIDRVPDINKFSGDMLYIDNRTSVSYSDSQLVTLRTIIQF